MDRFSKTHPVFQFMFFIAVFVVSLAIYNPVFSIVSILGAIMMFSLKIRDGHFLLALKSMPAIVLLAGVFNMLFSHYGVTVLFHIGSTEFTFESLFYGLNQGVVLSSAMLWFSALSKVIDSEKIVYIFRYMPKTALVFSMVLSFLPRFEKKLADIKDARLGLNSGDKPKGLKNKMAVAVNDFSVLVSYSLEYSVITTESMQARGYNPKTIRKGRYKIKLYDAFLMAVLFFLFAYVVYAKAAKRIVFIFEPVIKLQKFDMLAFVCFVLICFMPIIINSVEEILWKLSNVKN